METKLKSIIKTQKTLMLDCASVAKADGSVYNYYVLPSLPFWDKRRRKIRAEAFANLRAACEPDDGKNYVSFYEYTEKRGWNPCPTL